jgi:Abnormal spindle-like microcephaly-assoc'd, ASPM-SPD-2-Hydin/WD40-like Beta Propeller Repeat
LVLVVAFGLATAPARAGFPGHNGRLAVTLDGGRLATMGPAGGPVVPYSVFGHWPSWSPDGTKLAFNLLFAGIAVMDAYGRGLTRLGTGGDPAWSPDGTKIAFGTFHGIGIMNADGSNRHVLPNTSDSSALFDDGPAWSPDGKTIVFSKDHNQGDGQLWLVDADGGNPRHLTGGFGPAWAPDGQRIVFQANNRDGAAISTIKPDGTGLTAVADACCQTGTAWSPDGSRIAFFRNEGEAKALWTADPAGGTPTRIGGGFQVWDAVQRVDWQPLHGPWASPSTLDVAFPDTPTGGNASRFIELTNTGIARMQVDDVSISGPDLASFRISDDTCTGASLAPGSACDLLVHFGPDRLGEHTATLNFGDDAPLSPQTVSLSGEGVSPVALDPDPVAFGPVPIATESTPRTVTLRNISSASVVVNGVAVAGADAEVFAIGDDTCTGANIETGGSCTVTVRFHPDRVGARAARLEFSDDARGSPHSVALSGTGVSPVALSPSSIAFPPSPDHYDGAIRTVTLTNVAPDDLTIGAVALRGADVGSFILRGNTCSGRTPASGQSCTVQVRFRPLGAGAKRASLRFSDSAIDSPQTVRLAGTGTPGAWLERSAQALKFGHHQVGTTTAAKAVTLTNVGSAPLTISEIAKEGPNASDFRNLTQTCTAMGTLNPGESCTASIAFRPTATGPRAATLTITDTAPRNPHHIALKGTGT